MEIVKKVALVLIVVFSVGLVALMGVSSQRERAMHARIMAVEAQAKPYRDEILAIRNDLMRKNQSEVYTPKQASLLIGFVPTGVEDLEKIDDLMQGYAYAPVIILDCEQQLAVLEELLAALDPARCEVLLMATQDSDEVISAAGRLQGLLPTYGFDTPAAFLLRGKDYTMAALEHMSAQGFSPMVRYDADLVSGVTESGIPCLAYAMTSDESTATQMISKINREKLTVLVGFEFSRVADGALSLATIKTGLVDLEQQVRGGRMRHATIREACDTVLDINARNKALAAEHEAYVQRQKARIEELEEAVKQVYAQEK